MVSSFAMDGHHMSAQSLQKPCINSRACLSQSCFNDKQRIHKSKQPYLVLGGRSLALLKLTSTYLYFKKSAALWILSTMYWSTSLITDSVKNVSPQLMCVHITLLWLAGTCVPGCQVDCDWLWSVDRELLGWQGYGGGRHRLPRGQVLHLHGELETLLLLRPWRTGEKSYKPLRFVRRTCYKW